MAKLLDEHDNIKNLVFRQLRSYWSDVDTSVVEAAVPKAIEAIEKGFANLPNMRYYDGKNVIFSPYVSVQWMIFLYRLAREIFIIGGADTPKEADQVYYLNKILHANDWFYAADLPVHFLCEHPLGSVLGKASYGDYLFVYQGTTVGGNRTGDKLHYPTLGNNIILYANSTILGNSNIGNNVMVSAETYIINENIPDNCIVFGKSPNLVIKNKTEDEIKSYTEHIWGWDGMK